MNKKISTLLTAGLLMVGALLGSANAAPTAEAAKGDLQNRSEERRVGKECLRLCRSRWSPYH